ncbi:cas scaffolding protein family member 4 [Kryptolebias marmoratus]|uniref:Cas scaffold protein family member 4 n=1 Tax=Kryptolebias marmoratus TaxID=37003 RepID=A0A3Q3GHA5_KRYMA|nr:cas scaffolding protein family member 4 [Kryptolebias marmoratus]
MEKLAKALYDNTAECADELAFKKGDIITVMDENVAGTSGWWMCSLHGRHGLAPANRLKLLQDNKTSSNLTVEKNKGIPAKSNISVHGIYQIPNVARPANSPAYESMDMIYNIPSGPSSTSQSLIQSAYLTDGPEVKKSSVFNTSTSPKGDIYDVPPQARQVSLFTESTAPGQGLMKKTFIPISNHERRTNTPDSFVYAVPPLLSQDPNYDIPVPSATEPNQKIVGEYRTLPNPRKPEWIYDVPVGSGKQDPTKDIYDTLPSKSTCRQIYDIPPPCTIPSQRKNAAPSLYDKPKFDSLDIPSPYKVLPQIPTYNNPPTQPPTEESVYDFPSKKVPLSRDVTDPLHAHNPLECRGDPSNELKRVRLHRMRNFLACTTFCDLPGGKESLVQEDNQRSFFSAPDSQRISTASSSSTSSCDSLALSSSSPEPLREVTLSQDEACRKVLDLQESVFRAVQKLMDFVSSNWRYKENLEKHLKEIKEAAEKIVCSLTCFLSFAQDVKGNARCLTDINLQTRLYKQLTIVEDSAVILQQTESNLNMAGWPLNAICQDPSQVQTPDQLDRFVMVARTIPDDVKRLVSIIYANSKLLFKTLQKDPDSVNTRSPTEIKKSSVKTEQGELAEDDDDYVKLQTKVEEKKQEQKKPIKKVPPVSEATDNKHQPDSSCSTGEQPQSSLSEHCRLYFGALQKAIGGLVDSLRNGQPPEKFISQSKLVIMVGQRLVNTLYREAHRQENCQSLLCESSHLCALLKQLAVATKKAALHFPDKQVLQEVQEFANELAQKVQHFRTSLDL